MNNMVNSKKYLPMKMSKCYESKNKVNNNETLSHELHLNSWKPCHQILFNEDGRNVSDTSMKKCERKTHEINQGLKISEPLKNRTKYVIFNCRSRNLIYH